MRYVLVYVSDWPNHLLFVRKNKPDWQAGKLNFPGGHVEPGESDVEAAVRELREETNLDARTIYPRGRIICGAEGDAEVVVFEAVRIIGKAQQMTDEPLERVHFRAITFRNDEFVDSNIALMHGLIQNKTPNWKIIYHEKDYEIRIPR